MVSEAWRGGWGEVVWQEDLLSACALQLNCCVLFLLRGFPHGPVVKNLPAMQETWVRSLGQEDALEKETATRSSILAWGIPWTEEARGLQSTGSQVSDTT